VQTAGVIPHNGALKQALAASIQVSRRRPTYVINTERSAQTAEQAIVNLFSRWYDELGFTGASSDSGRSTLITNAARKIPGISVAGLSLMRKRNFGTCPRH